MDMFSYTWAHSINCTFYRETKNDATKNKGTNFTHTE